MAQCEHVVVNFDRFPAFEAHPLAQIQILWDLQPFEKSVPNGRNQLNFPYAEFRDNFRPDRCHTHILVLMLHGIQSVSFGIQSDFGFVLCLRCFLNKTCWEGVVEFVRYTGRPLSTRLR